MSWLRLVVRSYSLQLLARQGADDVSVHQIVFLDSQVRQKLVVGDSRLVHALGLFAHAQDALGASAADIDHEPAAGQHRQVVGDPAEQNARLFPAGQDIDAVTEHGLAATQECAPVLGPSECVCSNRPDAIGGHPRQALAKALETGQRTRLGLRRQTAIFTETGRQLHTLAHAVHHM